MSEKCKKEFFIWISEHNHHLPGHVVSECDVCEEWMVPFEAAWDIQQKRTEKLVEALKYYANKGQNNIRSEFGCGCCAGYRYPDAIDERSIENHDSDVRGLTAREALNEWEAEDE